MIRRRHLAAESLAVLLTCSLTCPAQQVNGQRLLEAAKKGDVPAVQSLLEKKVSPKVKDENGRTPLHLAACGGHQPTAEVLLRYRADINARDKDKGTPLDLAEITGHSELARFLQSKGGKRNPNARILNPSLKFATVREFEEEIREDAVRLDRTNICFFAPARCEEQARIVLDYLVKAYDALYQIVGTHTKYKMVVYAFPKGNPHAEGNTSECRINYDDSILDLASQPEWTEHSVPHVSGCIEEMAHNFVAATGTQFGWEMVGWSLRTQVALKVAGNPLLAEEIEATRKGQEQTFNEYVRNGCVVPRKLPANQCDRIHAWILYQCESEYGPRFWPDFFREVRGQKQAMSDASRLGGDKSRNARYQITIACFDRLPGIHFTKRLKDNGISLTTDVKSLHPEVPGWNRRLTE